jgi:hypothetical protein
MPRSAASITQADIARVIRAAKKSGAAEVEVRADFQKVAHYRRRVGIAQEICQCCRHPIVSFGRCPTGRPRRLTAYYLFRAVMKFTFPLLLFLTDLMASRGSAC